MNILRSDIEKICNYVESNKPSLPVGNIFYMDNISSHDEWVINQHKRINRQKRKRYECRRNAENSYRILICLETERTK